MMRKLVGFLIYIQSFLEQFESASQKGIVFTPQWPDCGTQVKRHSSTNLSVSEIRNPINFNRISYQTFL